MNDTLLFLLVLVTVGLILFVLAQPAQIIENEDFRWEERGILVIPGFLIGIPASQIEFQAIRVRKVDITVNRGQLLDKLNVWLDDKRDLVLLLTAKTADKKQGALVLAVSERLKDYVTKIMAQLGLGSESADVQSRSGAYLVFVFYGAAEAP